MDTGSCQRWGLAEARQVQRDHRPLGGEVVQNGLPGAPCAAEAIEENKWLALAETNVMEVHASEPPGIIPPEIIAFRNRG